MISKIVENTYLKYRCPGCHGPSGTRFHLIPIRGSEDVKTVWEFSGTVECPTLSPSIKCTGGHTDNEWTNYDPNFVCHHFVRAGKIEFCSDSTHALKGQTVPLEEFQEE